AHENVAKTHGRENQELNARALKSERIEDPIHLEEQNVRDYDGENHLRNALKEIWMVRGLSRREHQNGHEENGNNELQQHDGISNHIAKFFFNDRGSGAREAGDLQGSARS